MFSALHVILTLVEHKMKKQLNIQLVSQCLFQILQSAAKLHYNRANYNYKPQSC
jgi:hypothetical protein